MLLVSYNPVCGICLSIPHKKIDYYVGMPESPGVFDNIVNVDLSLFPSSKITLISNLHEFE